MHTGLHGSVYGSDGVCLQQPLVYLMFILGYFTTIYFLIGLFLVEIYNSHYVRQCFFPSLVCEIHVADKIIFHLGCFILLFTFRHINIRKIEEKKYISHSSLHFTDLLNSCHYSQIHPALQQIPAHSTLELCLWWLALDRDITSRVGAS